MDGNWYDYGKRFFDPAIARFTTIDPIATDVPALTPYQYASNSPVWCIDLDGMEGVPAQLMGNGTWSTAQSSTYVKEVAYANITQNNGTAGVIKAYEPNTFSQVKNAINNMPSGTGAAPGLVAAAKFTANVAANIINDATTMVTGLINGPENAVNAEGEMKNRSEFTEAGVNTIINLAPLPDKGLNVPGVKMNAAEFSVANKGTEVLTKAKSEVGTIIKQTNNATIDASQALKNSSQVVTTTSAVGNVKQQIDLEDEKP